MNRAITWLFLSLFLALPVVSFAQEVTETPPVPLLLDVTTQGALVGDDASTRWMEYRFELPEAQDVVIMLEADKIVYGLYCLQTSTSSSTVEVCPGGGGSGDDRPTLTYLYFPTDDNPRTRQFVTLTLGRPLEGIAHYTLTPYLVTPAPLSLEAVTDVSAAATPFQSYTLTHDPALHFTVEAEEPALDGDFLWVAYEPIGEIRDGGAFISQASLPSPKYLDSAGANDDQAGLQSMVLFYLGGDTFRLFVRSASAYALHGAAVETQVLESGEMLTVELSHRQPMQVVRLDSASAGEITLEIDLTEGTGVLAWLYTSEDAYGEFMSIGQTLSVGTGTPTTRTLELPASISERTVILQLPSPYSRDTLSVALAWQPQS